MTQLEQVPSLHPVFADASLSLDTINPNSHSPNSQPTTSANTDLVLRVAKHGTYLEVLASSHLLAGLPASELVGKTIQEVLPPDCARTQLHYIQQAFATKEMQTFEQQIACNGELRYEEVQVIAINDYEALLIVRDVSDHRRIYEHLNLQYAVTRTLTEFAASSVEGIIPQLSQLLQMICAGLHWQYGELWTLDDRQPVLHLAASWRAPTHELLALTQTAQRTQILQGEG
ncbi:MAG: PAS domain-containing protein, partial [Cyanobacteria bacterium]|nr:PAS domain-containing protein [Cyanobacteriota bacterium]MDW8201081.1 PAS domain-containing protein [Cyanobacteriota bacterium SKYGB_h_bin112]